MELEQPEEAVTILTKARLVLESGVVTTAPSLSSSASPVLSPQQSYPLRAGNATLASTRAKIGSPIASPGLSHSVSAYGSPPPTSTAAIGATSPPSLPPVGASAESQAEWLALIGKFGEVRSDIRNVLSMLSVPGSPASPRTWSIPAGGVSSSRASPMSSPLASESAKSPIPTSSSASHPSPAMDPASRREPGWRRWAALSSVCFQLGKAIDMLGRDHAPAALASFVAATEAAEKAYGPASFELAAASVEYAARLLSHVLAKGGKGGDHGRRVCRFVLHLFSPPFFFKKQDLIALQGLICKSIFRFTFVALFYFFYLLF